MAVVTFTTDFGTRDGYVGAMKGVVLSLCPGATLVDLTHEVPPQDVAAGGFALAQAAPLFPRGTIHVGVVDPGVGGERADLVIEADGSYFVGPDNGLFGLLLGARGTRWHAREIESPSWRREPVCPTFHGRDVFAPAAGRLAAGAPFEEAGPEVVRLVDGPWDPVALGAGTSGGGLPVSGEAGDARALGAAGRIGGAVVVHVDAFGNLVTSLRGTAGGGPLRLETEEGRAFSITWGRTFSDVERGALVAYVGSAGFVEIAQREGSAAALTGLGRGARLRLAGSPS